MRCRACNKEFTPKEDFCFDCLNEVRKESPWRELEWDEPPNGAICIVAAGPDSKAQYVPMRWDAKKKEFFWVDDLADDLDPFPTESATHWMYWPSDPDLEA